MQRQKDLCGGKLEDQGALGAAKNSAEDGHDIGQQI